MPLVFSFLSSFSSPMSASILTQHLSPLDVKVEPPYAGDSPKPISSLSPDDVQPSPSVLLGLPTSSFPKLDYPPVLVQYQRESLSPASPLASANDGSTHNVVDQSPYSGVTPPFKKSVYPSVPLQYQRESLSPAGILSTGADGGICVELANFPRIDAEHTAQLIHELDHSFRHQNS